MNAGPAPHAPDEPRPGSPRRPHWSLALAVAASALPFLALARGEFIGFDAFWHVFIARQDTWYSFWDEIDRNAHPPLFYLALKAAIAALGPNAIAYRLVSVAASLGSAWLVGRIVQRAAGHPWLPAIAAFTFGTSLTTVTVGLEVRAYALATFFMLWATLAFLDLVERSSAAPRPRARAAFALTTSLALLTHYVASLFFLGCCATAAVLTVVDRERRRRFFAQARRRWPASLLTFGVPLAVLALEYGVHVGSWSGRIHHLSAFMFDAGREGAFEFVWRNTEALFSLFAPALHHRPYASTLLVAEPGLAGWAVGALVAAFLAAAVWLACAPARGGGNGAVARRVPPLLLLAMTALLVALALVGRYPYGGTQRHQYFLFPFLVVVPTLAVAEVVRGSPRRIGALAVCLLALAGVLNTANWASHFEVTRGYLMQRPMNRFRELLPAPEAVYVDQFNLIHVFTHHRRWRWRFVHRGEGGGEVDVWRVSQAGAREFYVCRDRRQWLLDFSRPLTYRHLRGCLDVAGAERVAVFRTQQPRRTPRWPVARAAELAAREAPRAGLVPDTVVVSGDDLFAAFSRR